MALKTASRVVALAVLGIASAAHAQTTAEPEAPNIIVYLSDDVGVEAFGSYGGTSFATPNIDQLAAEVFVLPERTRCPCARPPASRS